MLRTAYSWAVLSVLILPTAPDPEPNPPAAHVATQQQPPKPKQPQPIQPAQQPTAPIEVKHTEADSVGWAFDALLKYPADAQPFIRFVYIPPWADPEWLGVMDFAVNTACNQTRTLHRGDVHAGGWLLAYDLSRFATGKQLESLLETWDSIAVNDPYFHVPAINQVVPTKAKTVTKPVTKTVAVEKTVEETCEHCKGSGRLKITYTDGTVKTEKCYHCKGVGHEERTVTVQTEVVEQVATEVDTKPVEQDDAAAILAPHLQEALARHVTDPSKDQRVDVLLTQMTASSGGIYRADWMLEQLLTSVRGKYPEFRQLDFDGGGDKQTPLQFHLAQRGFSVEQALEARGEKGALLLISNVTGKSRVVLATFGVSSRTPLVSTYDYKDSSTRPDEQFIRNLVQFDALHDAAELFVPLQNGLIEYLLTDDKGNFQRTAPPDVVADSTKPDGYTKELEMGMSCVLCHSDSNGYKTAANDMDLLLGADVDFFGDELTVNIGGKKQTLTREEVVDLVVGRYAERIDEPDSILGRSRRDYMQAVAKLTDYTIQADGPSIVGQLGLKIKEIYHGYRYKRIDATLVCRELGVEVGDAPSTDVLTRLVPPVEAGGQEDILVALLRNSAIIKRDDFEAIYGEMARRAVLTRNSITERN